MQRNNSFFIAIISGRYLRQILRRHSWVFGKEQGFITGWWSHGSFTYGSPIALINVLHIITPNSFSFIFNSPLIFASWEAVSFKFLRSKTCNSACRPFHHIKLRWLLLRPKRGVAASVGPQISPPMQRDVRYLRALTINATIAAKVPRPLG